MQHHVIKKYGGKEIQLQAYEIELVILTAIESVPGLF
jgi:hypothetical protein